MIFAYIRVSTKDQHIDRQQECIEKYCDEHNLKIDRTYVDMVSGKNFERPEYIFLKGNLRTHDVIIIKELDRLGRNMELIKKEWQYYIDNQIEVIVIDTPILSTNSKTDLEKALISNIVFEILSYLSEKERTKIKQRQAEGIKIAKSKGTHMGRHEKPLPDNWNKIQQDWRDKKITARKASELAGFSIHTFYRRIKNSTLQL